MGTPTLKPSGRRIKPGIDPWAGRERARRREREARRPAGSAPGAASARRAGRHPPRGAAAGGRSRRAFAWFGRLPLCEERRLAEVGPAFDMILSDERAGVLRGPLTDAEWTEPGKESAMTTRTLHAPARAPVPARVPAPHALAAVPPPAPPAAPPPPHPLAAPTEEMIRHRAYEHYLARNGGPGDALGDWLRAESELRSEYERRGGMDLV